MKPKVSDLEFKEVKDIKIIIQLLVESWEGAPFDIKIGEVAFFDSAYAIVYDDYMVSPFEFKFECVQRADGVYVYKLPPNLPYTMRDGVRDYEGDY
jgi:hypothetical protein